MSRHPADLSATTGRLESYFAGGTPWLWLALLGFFSLACYRLGAIGLYADEVLYVPAAYQALGQCGVEAPVSLHGPLCVPLYLNPPYLGASKALLQAPVFAAFGSGPIAVRLPAVILAAFALVLIFLLLRRMIGVGFASVAVVFLAFDPVFLFHARFDWGPVMIGMVCKIGMLIGLVGWLNDRRILALYLTVFLALFGLYDKLNFIWVLMGVALMIVTAYPKTFFSSIKEPRAWPALAVALIGFSIIVVFLILPAMKLSIAGFESPWRAGQQWNTLHGLYNHTFSGASSLAWVFGKGSDATELPWMLLMSQLAFSILAWLPGLSHRLIQPKLLVVFRATSMLLLGLLLSLYVTRQVGGSHHLMTLWPLPQVHLLLCVYILMQVPWAWRLAPVTNRSNRLAIFGVLFAAFVVQFAYFGVHNDYLRGYRGEFGFRPLFDPNISALASFVEHRDEALIVAADWGLTEPLQSLLSEKKRARVKRLHDVFSQRYDSDIARNEHIWNTLLKPSAALIVTHAEGKATFPKARQNFGNLLENWPGCAQLLIRIPGMDGKVLYEVFRLDPNKTCADPVLLD